jgi:3-hydroxyacyl-[acyl-carrier-protein] dehydratase
MTAHLNPVGDSLNQTVNAYNASKSAPISFDIHQVLNLLPHRYPFLLVDRVLELNPGENIIALKNVSINEPFFQGHFPQKPVMPGVLILESLAQAAALLTFGTPHSETQNTQSTENHQNNADTENTGSSDTSDVQFKRDPNKLYYFVGIDEARFKKVVEPGDQMHLHVVCERYIRGIWKFDAKALVNGQVACQAKLMCTVKDA